MNELLPIIILLWPEMAPRRLVSCFFFCLPVPHAAVVVGSPILGKVGQHSASALHSTQKQRSWSGDGLTLYTVYRTNLLGRSTSVLYETPQAPT